MNLKNRKSGFTLLEVIGAILIISIGVLGVMNIIPQIISDTSKNSSRLIAAYLAQEGIEIIRDIRDGNWLEEQNKGDGTPWNEGLTECTAGCEADYTILGAEDPLLTSWTTGVYLKIDSTNGFYNYSAGSNAKFKRKITIDNSNPDILIVSVNVFWEEKGINHELSVQEKLYKWY